MNTFKITFIIILLLIFNSASSVLKAQVSINSDGSSPDASSMLDITSTDKGILIPRMTTAQRRSISSPAVGLMVYDTENRTFWYYQNGWNEILSDNQIYMNYDEEVSSVSIGKKPIDVKVAGNYLYIVEQDDDQVSVYDISNPMSPTLASSLSFPSSVSLTEIVLNGDYAYVTSSTNSSNFWVLDISDPTNISSLGSFDLGGKLYGVAASGSYAYVTDRTQDYMRVIKVNTPTSPTEVSSIAINNPYTIYLEGDLLYVADYDNSSNISIINISSPTTPILKGSVLVNESYVLALKRIDDLLYLGGESNGTYPIVDVSSSTTPTISNNTIPQSSGLATYGNFLIISSTSGYGFKIYDVSDENNISTVYSNGADVYEDVYDMVVNDNYLYMLDSFNDELLIRPIGTPYMKTGTSASSESISLHDNLGDHIALENIQLNNLHLSNDGDNEGISIEDDGTVNISDTLKIAGKYTLPLADGNANQTIVTNGNGILSWIDASGAFSSNSGVTVANNNSDDFLIGTTTLNHSSGIEQKLFFDNDKGVFRAGSITGDEWDSGNLGDYSAAVGYSTTASGKYSFASGLATVASGKYAVAMGTNTTAINDGTFAVGSSTTASGQFAMAVGSNSIASGDNSFAGGSGALASGNGAVAFGSATYATGDYSTAFGSGSYATGNLSTVFGLGSAAPGANATAFGLATSADGSNSTAFGVFSEARSYVEFAIGSYCTDYTPNSTSSFNTADRVFVIGNGTGSSARSDALTVYKSGKTEINGELSVSGTINTNQQWISGDGDSEGIFINTDGNIGIGTNSPTQGKLVISGTGATQSFSGGTYGYFSYDGWQTNLTSLSNFNYAIYTDERIAAWIYHTISDERVKDIKGLSDNKADLETLKKIKITDYQFKDKIKNGDISQKKVIAQQVAQVYPQAVTKNTTEIVPDIFQKATIDENGWVEALQCNVCTDLKKGDKVKLFFENHEELVEILEVKNERFRVQQATGNGQPETVFIYGRQVDDFHTVDYEAISMLNVSATQQLAKENEKLKKRVQELEAQVAKINQLEALLQNLQSEIQTSNISANNNE